MDSDQRAIACLRGLCMDMPARAQSGHSGTAMALAPLGWLLYSRILRLDPQFPDWPDRDRLILSNGHAVVLLYGLLHLCGYDLSLKDLQDFRVLHSRTPGHPETWMTPGIDFSTGPLGQGLASAVGMAWAEQRLSQQFGDLVDHYTYVICSDGDLMEGVSAEACSLAGGLGLEKLIVFYDDNGVTIEGPTSLSFHEDVAGRFASYGWNVDWVDGEDLQALQTAIEQAQQQKRPSLIGVKTVIGWPSPLMQGRCEAHSPHFPGPEIARTKELLGLDPDLEFQLPQVQPRQSGLAREWQQRLELSGRLSEWQAWQRRQCPELPALDWSGPISTRQASGRILQCLAERMPQLLAGSADLSVSTCVRIEPPERNLYFGVREQAMAAICNGMVAHGGLLPVASTYFAFSDQMKPGLRLAALSGLATISVWTHDSLALGEDGPTHQPVEQLASLRAMPNFLVLRPADARELEAAWKVAIDSRLPVGLVLSRQNLPLLEVTPQLEKGAYVVREGPAGAPTLLASGSEVHLCLEAAAQVGDVRVVSFPCWELFAQQSREYQAQVLGSGPRLAVEAASPWGWYRWADDVLGLDSFGCTGPGPAVMAEMGFTVEAVAQKIRDLRV